MWRRPVKVGPRRPGCTGRRSPRRLELEKATLFFYQSLKDVLDDNEEVDHLIETEKRRVSALMKVLLNDARGVSTTPGSSRDRAVRPVDEAGLS